MRRDRERSSNRDTLLLSTGESVGSMVGMPTQPDGAQQCRSARAHRAARLAADVHRRFHDVFESRHMVEQVEVLEDHADARGSPCLRHIARRAQPLGRPLVAHVSARNRNVAAIKAIQVIDQAEKSALAASRWAP